MRSQISLRHVKGPHGTFTPELLDRVDKLFVNENLTQTILHAHLLLEQALLKRIEQKCAKPQVFAHKKFSPLSFSQKITVYAALYEPEEETVNLLIGFNRLRNMIAHQLTDEASHVYQCLKFNGEKPLDDPGRHVKATFLYLALFDLGAIHGLKRTDINDA